MIETNQSRLYDFDDLNEHGETLHRGCLDENIVTNTIMMVMNANGCRDQHVEKIDQIIECCKNKKVKVAMLSKTNGKWTTRTTDAMSSKMKELGRETRCHYADVKAHEKTDSD